MTDEVTDAICFDMVVAQRDAARRRIEKLEAGEIEFDRVIGGYASENAQFRDRIGLLKARAARLEDALRELLSLGEWGLNDLARTIAREALGEHVEETAKT